MTNKHSRRAQAAMEYLFVVGFAFALLIPIILLYYTQSSSFEEEVQFTQARNAAQDIITAADNIHYLGVPSKTTINVRLPSNIRTITIDDNTIILSLDASSGPYEIARQATTTLEGTINPAPGLKRLSLQATTQGVSIHEE